MRGFVRYCLLGSLAALLALAGCSGKFFPPLSDGGGGGGGGGGSNSGSYLYVGNLGTNPLTVAGFSISTTGSLGVIPGSAWQVSLEPNALAVTPNNAYLYVGSAAGGIYVYTISGNGSISLANNGAPVATGVEPSVLRVDPGGNWLIGADAFSGEAYVFQIGAGGLLTSVSSSFVTLNTATPATDLEITPNDAYVFVSCGTAGIYTLSFNSANGDMVQVNRPLLPRINGGADYGMAIAPSGNFLFVAETAVGAVRVFSIAGNGGISEISSSPYAVGTGAYTVLVDSTGKYLYVADRTAGNIKGFNISGTGTLTTIAGSPFATGKLPVALVEDNSATYVAAISSGGSPDLTLYKFDSTTPGALDKVTTATTGTDPTQPSSLAATH